jgi:hypothetical protein
MGCSIVLQLIQVNRIWQQANHNAFTDLIDFNGALWCVFREGSAHVSPDGAFRILRCDDGQHWQSVALLSDPKSDLRDAKFCLMPDNTLTLLGAGALHDNSTVSHQSYIWQSDNGTDWSARKRVGQQNIWLWRMTWHKQLYAVGYRVGQPRFVRLYQGESATHLQPLSDIHTGEYANESGLLFEPDGTALCLLRRDPDTGLFGQSQPPYKQWQWQSVGSRIGGPQWLQLPDKRLLACVRLYDNEVRTSLCWIDRTTGRLTEALTLPSGGDCSYAGMVLRQNVLYISYYSSHEDVTAIYIAQVAVQ